MPGAALVDAVRALFQHKRSLDLLGARVTSISGSRTPGAADVRHELLRKAATSMNVDSFAPDEQNEPFDRCLLADLNQPVAWPDHGKAEEAYLNKTPPRARRFCSWQIFFCAT